MMQQAEQAFHRGNLQEADGLCRAILERDPADAPATLLSGLISAKLGETERAIEMLQQALKLSPGDYIALTWLQVQLRIASRYSEAVAIGLQALNIWPRDVELLISFGLSATGMRDADAAIEALGKAAKFQPKNPAIHHHLGVAYELLGKDSEAAVEYQTSIHLAPKVERGYLQLGRLMMGHGNYVQVLDLCESALKVLPNSAQIHLMYAQCYRNLRDRELAEPHLQRAIQLDPQFGLSAAFWLHEDGKFDAANVYFRKSIEQRPLQGMAYFGLVQGKKIDAGDEGLLSTMEGLLRDPSLRDRERSSLHYGLGKAYNDLKRFSQAIEHYDAGNRLNYKIYLASRGFDKVKNRALLQKVIDMFSPAYMAENLARGSESKVPIFVVGMIRSGTTLVEQILSSHPAVGAAGEQRFWLSEIPRALDLESRTLDWDMFSEMQDRYLRVLRSFQPDSERVTDKMPLNFYWVGLIHLAFPNSPIVHVKRNPVDNALSIYMTELAKPPDFAHDKANIVEAYREYQTIMGHWRSVIPTGNLIEVQYEDLVANQEAESRRLVEFCGMEWDPGCLEFHSNTRPVNTPSLWQVRQPIYSSSVEKWRNYEEWLGELRALEG